jgi:hypothetical protein
LRATAAAATSKIHLAIGAGDSVSPTLELDVDFASLEHEAGDLAPRSMMSSVAWPTQGIAEMAQEAQQEIGATTAAQSHTGRSTPSTI